MTLARAHNRHTVPLTVSVILDLNSGHYQGQIKPVVRVGLGLEASGLQIKHSLTARRCCFQINLAIIMRMRMRMIQTDEHLNFPFVFQRNFI